MRLLLPALLLVLAAAAPAHAQTALFQDDAEGAIEDLWVVGEPDDPRIQPWQKSDSTTLKARGNQAHGGTASYWSGSSPQDFQPTEVVAGSSTMTTKAPFIVPADGSTSLSLWSFFHNEGDDEGLIEVAPDEGGVPGAWKRVARHDLEPSAVGDVGIPGYCNPADPIGTVQTEFVEIKGSLAAFAGQSVFLRLHLKYGSENRSATQPCGWYVDDIAVTTTGTPGLRATEGGGPTGGPPAAAPKVALSAVKARGKRARFKVTVSGGSLKDVVATLRKGRKSVARLAIGELAEGSRTLTMRVKRKLRRGRYSLQLSGKAADGSSVAATRAVRVR
jgi:hypothetical protein